MMLAEDQHRHRQRVDDRAEVHLLHGRDSTLDYQLITKSYFCVITRMCAAETGDTVTSMPALISSDPFAVPSRPVSTDRTSYVAPPLRPVGLTVVLPVPVDWTT